MRKCDITQPILTFAKRVAVGFEMLMMAFNKKNDTAFKSHHHDIQQ